MCDQISDAILDAHLKQDPDAKVACETVTKTGMIMVRGLLLHEKFFDSCRWSSHKQNLKYLLMKPVLRIWIHWIRKIWAPWIRIQIKSELLKKTRL